MHYSSSKALLIKAAGLSVFALAVYAGSASTANALLRKGVRFIYRKQGSEHTFLGDLAMAIHYRATPA
jgi:hypothetical protein